MKLFQIEEPEGPPLDASGPGAAVGIGLGAEGGAVACAVGGNAEILRDANGEGLLQDTDLAALLLALRSRAEKQLARPVTHAVIASSLSDDAALARAAEAAGLALLGVRDAAEGTIAAALAAAELAETLAPRVG